MAEKTFACEICGKEKSVGTGGETPLCCGRPMAPKLENCRMPFVAETARPGNDDEPCDDGTNGNK